ncbi:MAG TPA: AAA family ATPase, partial [Amycolatopsis sp.]|nr:AAA family ATPase [Amycolatopsis sp.]
MTVSELGVFAGRVAECDAVGAALDELATGARVMTVTGDPGLGKTRLLDEAARMAAARGFVVLRGQASRQRGAAFTDALHEHRDGLDRLRAASGDDPYRAVRALLEELASPGLALLLDDLHHADDGTMDLVAALLRHPPRASVLVVLAYRPRQAPLPLREAVEGRLAPVDRLRLEPLAEADVRTLLGARDTPSRRRMLHRRSGGNPLYLGGVSDCVHEVCTCAVEVPAALRVNVAAELADLPAIAGNLARAVSVLDGPFGIDLSTDLAELARPEVIAAMDDLVRADLVRPVTGTALFDFRHPLVRQVLYESVDPAWRIAAHTRAAQALQVRRASVVTLGRHLEFAVSAGDPRGIASLVEAARVVRPQDPAIAVRWLQRALRLIPAEGLGPAVPNRADVLISLAGALAVTGKLDASRAALHEARGLVQPGAPGRSGRALALCALVERLLGRDAEARALLLRELSAPTGGDPELAFAFASGELVRGRLPSGREWAERALAGARLRRSRTLTASAQGLLAMAETFAGALETAGTHASAAADLVDGLIDGEFRQRPDVAVWLGWAELLLERPEAALRHLDRALDAGRAGGNVLLLP